MSDKTTLTDTYTHGSQASDLNTEGLGLGQSAADLVGFHGTTPTAQRSGASQAAFASLAASSPGYGFASAAELGAAVNLILEIRAALVAKGFIAGE
jgi:hypothetical protein